ncbi:MAG: hypothetical protein K0S64_58 [Gaiellaceae bacterium]|nr:hypothetical protein [Gaiellaceae bacterium]
MREHVRKAAADHDGAEVDWAGDGVFLAFSRATNAVAAAAQIQRALAEEPWPDDEAHRLRIGIHTGEPDLAPDGYTGMDVVIAARVCASAHGEQIVVTRTTRDMAGAEPLPGAAFRPLGRHRLKDVPAAVQAFQLLGPGLRVDFPPLKTLTATSLPALHHRLVGRADALARVEALLESPEVRLATITGPGGAGKSRLALEVAARAALDRAVYLVGLAPILDPELVPGAIARAIGARESGSRSVIESIADNLGGAGALLYLDNLEHLPTVAAQVTELLDRVPDLQVLATSRTPLRLSTERVLPLEPLALDDATTLFVELAAARGVLLQDDALASVHEICRRLDGLPLAIELVAARLAVLPPSEILRALGEGLALEMEGPVDLPERQRTLRAAIDWSYQRLSPGQRDLHGALAVFADSATLDDARAVAEAGPAFLSDLEALVGWSLIRSDSTDGEVRLSMLETVREHALGNAEAEGHLEELQRGHAERFLALALEAEGHLAGTEQAQWLERLEREFDNLRAALDWLLASARAEDVLRAISALERFWRAHAHVGEARRWLTIGLELGTNLAPDVRADALWASARQAAAQSDWQAAVPVLQDALVLFRAQGRRRDIAFALSELAFIALRRGDKDLASSLSSEALIIARELDEPRATSGVLAILADVSRIRGDFEQAVAFSDEALALRRSLGDATLVMDSIYHVGVSTFAAGDYVRSTEALMATLELAGELGDALYRAAALCMLGAIDLLRGDVAPAHPRLDESLSIYTALADDRSMAECLCALGGYAAATGRPVDAARLWGAADRLRGDSPLEYAEPAIEERFLSVVIDALGERRYLELRSEGRSTGTETTAGVLVGERVTK